MRRTPREIYDWYKNIPSHDMQEYLPFLRAAANGRVLEIGVRDGVSTAAFLLGLERRGSHLYSVDVEERCGDLYDHLQWSFIHENSHNVRLVDEKLRVFGLPALVFDVVFIDGDHSREGVRADLYNYGPLVRQGGMLLAHDVAITVPVKQRNNWPGPWVREEFDRFQREMGWPGFIIPGKFGMGVLIRE
jgi:predicted O-methyltransferase YrrM